MKLFQISADDIKEELPYANELNLIEESTEFKDEAMFSSFKLCETKKESKLKNSKLKTKTNNNKNISFNPCFNPEEATFTIEEVEERIKTFEKRLKNKPEDEDILFKQILFERAKIEVLG